MARKTRVSSNYITFLNQEDVETADGNTPSKVQTNENPSNFTWVVVDILTIYLFYQRYFVSFFL